MKEYRDHYFLKAKQENYPARSVYKLQEIDAKFRLFRRGMHILDLGAAPGSWSLWASRKIGPEGRILALDLHSIDCALPPNVVFRKQDIFALTPENDGDMAELAPFDIVMSDMAPRTTGTRFTDQARSLELAVEAFSVATLHLKTQGHFIVKIFMGPDIQELLTPMRRVFRTVKSFKPKSSRAESKETFFVASSFLGLPSDSEHASVNS
ncbi:MAG: RlmE family RNA methyltransferase [Desulfovibrio sp.]|nr:RlmE family RNA methyltransferase [Desulfovibrio sp.]